MNETNQHVADEVNQTIEQVRMIRDELKVQLHLGSMEAKERFAELERRFDNEQLNVRKNFKELLLAFTDMKQAAKQA